MNQPPTAPVNPEIQCMTAGCGTMLLDDGTCPRCNPPSRRSTAEKLQLAKHYKDPKLQALAHAEVEAGLATGFEDADFAPPPPRHRQPRQQQQRPQQRRQPPPPAENEGDGGDGGDGEPDAG